MSTVKTLQPRKFLLPSLTMAAVASAVALASTPLAPAPASATGCQFRNGFGISVKGVNLKVPKGYLCHSIRGKGKTIRQQSAAYSFSKSGYGLLTGKICNWRIDFIYTKASNGKRYRTDRGRTQNKCSLIAKRNVNTDKLLKHYGKSCAVLYSNGHKVTTQCHNIIKSSFLGL